MKEDSLLNFIVAAGADNICSPQFEEILKDKFLKALPSNIAANSGNWNYTDLRTLANCSTQAINANKRYGKSDHSVLATAQEQLPPVDRHPNSYGAPKTFSQVRRNSFRSRSRLPNFRQTPDHLSRTRPCHFNVINVIMVIEDFGITINITNIGFAK